MKILGVTERERDAGNAEVAKLFARPWSDRSAGISVSGISEATVQLQQPKLPSAVHLGSEVELRCHVDGSGDMKYEWFKLVA